MIEYTHFLFLEIDWHLSNLLLCWHQFTSLPLLTHLQNFDFSYMIIIIEVVFGCVNAFGFILDKSHTSRYNFIISVLVVFGSLLSDFLNSFDEAIMISIGIVGNNSHSSIDFNYLFPMWHFTRSIELNTLKFIRITIFSL